MLTKWRDEVFSLLKTNASLGSYHNVLVRMKAEGVSSAEAEELFNEIRTVMINEGNEEGEDRILEVLDFVAGWCAPHNRVW